MIKSIDITGFKKFKHLKIDGFRRINLFVGINNVGKSSLLEAILGACCGQNIDPAFGMSMLHRMNVFNLLSNSVQLSSSYKMASILLQFFNNGQNINDLHFSLNINTDEHNFSIKHEFEPSSIFSEFFPKEMGSFGNVDSSYVTENLARNQIFNNQSIRQQFLGNWKITINDDMKKFGIFFPNIAYNSEIIQPLILARYNDVFSHREENENRRIYAFLSRSNEMETFIGELNNSFPGLGVDKIENIPYPDGSEASISFKLSGGVRMPLYAMGDGVRRWYNILGGMIIYSNAVHCLEEVDSGFHYEAQGQLCKNLTHYAKKYNNQIFMTTHNKEYVLALLNTVETQDNDFLHDEVRIITLRQGSNELEYRVLDGNEAIFAYNNGLELRL